MKRLLLASVVALLAVPVLAQTTNAPVGQNASGTINQSAFSNNSDAAGFSESALTPAFVVPSTATTQILAPVITTRTTVITTCSSTTGVELPAVQRYVPIAIMNRSGGSCLIWPSGSATVETALGTNGSVNAPFTMLTNTDIVFRPVSATQWLQ